MLFEKNERAVLTSCALQDTFYPLRLDPYRLTCASYMGRTVRRGGSARTGR